jgi:hypothetical protein
MFVRGIVEQSVLAAIICFAVDIRIQGLHTQKVLRHMTSIRPNGSENALIAWLWWRVGLISKRSGGVFGILRRFLGDQDYLKVAFGACM